MPSGEAAPLEDAPDIRAPLLLVFGGRDELISQNDVELTVDTLRSNNKRFDVQAYPNVGHSFFRSTGNSVSRAKLPTRGTASNRFWRKILPKPFARFSTSARYPEASGRR